MKKTDLLLDTESYRKHHKFYFILVVNLLLTFIWVDILMQLGPVYGYIRRIIMAYPILTYSLLFANIVNNVYQVYAHIFTGVKFMGCGQIYPYGSDKDQSLAVFTLSNIFDILGWMTIYVYYGYASFFVAALGAFHYSTELIAIFFNKTFHKYFIGLTNDKIKNNNNFKYVYWRTFRSLFVFTDAISRGYLSYCMMLDYL